MLFGLCNALSTFQRLMELVLAGLHWSTCLAYLDDIIIYSHTVEDHFQKLEAVFQRLQQAGLKIKPWKCSLFRKSVHYLSHIISQQGLHTDPEKTKCMAAWSTPMNHNDLRKFLGFTSYYRQFVKNFAYLAAPLQ